MQICIVENDLVNNNMRLHSALLPTQASLVKM